MVRKILGFVVLMVLSAQFVVGQSQYGRLQGTVINAKTGEPVEGAEVVVKVGGQQKGTITNADGKYEVTAIPPGTYDVVFQDVRFGKKLYKDVPINAGRTKVKDAQLTAGKEFEVVTFEEHGVFSKDKRTDSEEVDAENIEDMPTKNVNEMISLNTDINSQGGGLSIQGQRSSGTLVKVDGIRVRNLRSVPTRSIQQIQTITAGIPAKHGDATGGVINITTKGPSKELSGGFELISSQFLDPYNYNNVEGNLSGPIFTKNKGTDSAETKLGFMLGGALTYQKEPRPAVLDHWVVDDNTLSDLKEKPLRRNPVGQGFISNARFVTKDEMKQVSARPNVERLNYNLTGKLNYSINDEMNLVVGGQYGYRNSPNYSRTRSMFNYENYQEVTRRSYRTYLRFTQTFKDDASDEGGLSNVFYSIQLDYSNDLSTTEHPEFGKDFFKYGYYGKFNRYRSRSYEEREDSLGGGLEEAQWMTGFQDTAVTFEQADINKKGGNYSDQFFEFRDGNVSSFEELRGAGGLINGESPQSIYSLWDDVGTPTSVYNEVNEQSFSLKTEGSFDIGSHSIELGVQYEQYNRSQYAIAGSGLWSVMRQSANAHIQQLDTDNPMPTTTDDGTFTDTVNFQKLDDGQQNVFDKRFRDYLKRNNRKDVYGNPIDEKSFINVDRYKPEDFSMSMFSADNLLRNLATAGAFNYYGYDHKGNKTSNDPSVKDFLNNPQTRPQGAYNPIYTAGYLQDNFQVKDLFFRVGVRVDRFDNNQPVLKDRYSLYPTRTVGQVEGSSKNDLLGEGESPGNIGSDHVVYVDDALNPNDVIGYRKGDNWFNDDGEEVNDPNTLAFEAGTGTIEPFLTDQFDNRDDIELVEESFKDYEPQVVVMPRVAFSFPISDEARFRASYDALSQRPKSQANVVLSDYYYLQQASTQFIGNPNLKPEKSNKFTLGFKQQLSARSAFELKAFYTETRDMIQVRRVPQAFPTPYLTYQNLDFSTTKGLTARYDLSSSRSSPVRFTGSYTLQFATGTGSNDGSQRALIQAGQPNLRAPFPLNNDYRHNFQGNLDYRFRSGERYTGPVTGENTQLLKNVGFNFIVRATSGGPYTRYGSPFRAVATGVRQQPNLDGTINGSRLPWNFNVDLRIDKNIPIDFGGGDDKEKPGATSVGPQDFINIYLRIQNVFDARNVTGVYQFSGDPTDDGYLSSPEGQQRINQQVNQQAYIDQYRAKVNNPFNFQPPRLIRLGARLSF